MLVGHVFFNYGQPGGPIIVISRYGIPYIYMISEFQMII